MTILHGCEFWGVDFLKSGFHTQNSGFHWQAATRNEDIDLEFGEYVPVGHIWKFDLEQCE